eukprot:3450471-Heterocapsa_arctica.AAC.1
MHRMMRYQRCSGRGDGRTLWQSKSGSSKVTHGLGLEPKWTDPRECTYQGRRRIERSRPNEPPAEGGGAEETVTSARIS